MSQCTFIAANVPLAEVRSPHYSTFSINEAVAAGTALDADILGCGIDPDEPDVVLACGLDSGKDPDNFRCSSSRLRAVTVIWISP